MKKILLKSALICGLCGQLPAAVFNGVYADTNNVILPGYTFSATYLFDRISTNNLPTNAVTAADLAAQVLAATNTVTTNLTAAIATARLAVTNLSRAFTAVLPASNSTVVITISNALPTTKYSIALLPQNTNTAGAARGGIVWWADTKTTTNFTLRVNFATNAYNLNFDCLLYSNTQ